MSDDMRATRHCGREGYAKHNDREFDTERADHIDTDRTQDNFYWHCYSKSHPEMNFTDAEMHFYKHCYSTSLDAKNNRYVKQGHKERTKTIEDLYKAPRTRPTETIYQVGNKEKAINVDLLKDIFSSYLRKISAWNKSHGSHYHILSIALHADETTPHLHERGVWDIETPEGRKVAQDRALEAAGVPLPDPSKPRSRYNNRKMTIDALFRGFWIESCREFGLTIEEEPLPRRKHKSKEEYIDTVIQDKQKNAKTLLEQIETMQADKDTLQAQINDIDASMREKYHVLVEMCKDADWLTDHNDFAQILHEEYPDVFDRVQSKLYEDEMDTGEYEQELKVLSEPSEPLTALDRKMHYDPLDRRWTIPALDEFIEIYRQDQKQKQKSYDLDR